MSKFQIGDPALVIKTNVEANLGRSVTVRGFSSEEYIKTPNGTFLNPDKVSCCVVEGSLVTVGLMTHNVRVSDIGVFKESCLMPLNGFSQDMAYREAFADNLEAVLAAMDVKKRQVLQSLRNNSHLPKKHDHRHGGGQAED